MVKSFASSCVVLALTAGSSIAADLPLRSPPPMAPLLPSFTWTGMYAGINAGYAFSDNNSTRTRGNNGVGAGALQAPFFTNTVNNVANGRRIAAIGSSQDGFSGGGGFGFNYQLTPGNGLVFGLEADAMYMDLDRSRTYVSGLGDPSTYRQSLDFLGTVRGRVGYAFDRVLVYGTGGFAYGSVDYDARFFGNAAARPLAYSGSYSQIETGYVYGGGVEYAMPTASFLNVFNASAVTLKGEYLRYDLGSRNITVAATGNAPVNGSYTSRFNTEGNIVRAGLNYKFGGF